MRLTTTPPIPEFPCTRGLSHDQHSMGSESSVAIVKERGPVVADEGYPKQTTFTGLYDRLLPGVTDIHHACFVFKHFSVLKKSPQPSGMVTSCGRRGSVVSAAVLQNHGCQRHCLKGPDQSISIIFRWGLMTHRSCAYNAEETQCFVHDELL